MRIKKHSLKVVCVAALLAVALAVPVGAFSYISDLQYVLVGSTSSASFSYVIYVDYVTGAVTYDSNYGAYFSLYSLVLNGYLGIFLYDWDTQRYQDVVYAYLQDL
jgi:hypothetical protein